MNRNEQFVITINRELGSGGRTVGRLVAEKLGVPFLDKALIKALQEKYNLSVEEIEKQKGRKHDWWSEFKRIMLLGHSYGNSHYAPMPFGTVNGEFDLIPDDMSFLPGDFNIASANMSYPDMLTTDENADRAIYNLSGQRVSDSYKGVVIINGKKVLRK